MVHLWMTVSVISHLNQGNSLIWTKNTLTPTSINLSKIKMIKKEDTNPYGPPKSSLEISSPTTMAPYFFTTSTLKLTLMSICTLGLYELYWFYKNWVLIKERTGQNLMPFWRAFFAPIWAYSCFKHIKTSAGENNLPESFSAGSLALLYFLLEILWRLPDPFWLISIFGFIPIVVANKAALKVNKTLIFDFNNNEKFSAWNWVGLVLGGLLFLLSVLGAFLGAFLPEV